MVTIINKKIVVATRALNPELFQLSGACLTEWPPYTFVRHQISYTPDACEYFRALLQLDADWVVNIDEDAFLLDPPELYRLIECM